MHAHGLLLPGWIYVAHIVCLVLTVLGAVLAALDRSPRTWTRIGMFVLYELVWGALTVLSGLLIWTFGGLLP